MEFSAKLANTKRREVDTLNSGLVRGDGGTFDSDVVLLNGVGSVNCNLIVGSITVFDAQIKILDIDIQKGQDQLFLDHLPDDPGHFISIKFNNRIRNFNLLLSCNREKKRLIHFVTMEVSENTRHDSFC